MTHAKLSARRSAGGMTLVEVLVTLVIISVGLLGLAALQLTSLKGNQEAYARSQASALAGFILDRMRANPNGFRDRGYSVALDGTGTAGNHGRQRPDCVAKRDRPASARRSGQCSGLDRLRQPCDPESSDDHDSVERARGRGEGPRHGRRRSRPSRRARRSDHEPIRSDLPAYDVAASREASASSS